MDGNEHGGRLDKTVIDEEDIVKLLKELLMAKPSVSLLKERGVFFFLNHYTVDHTQRVSSNRGLEMCGYYASNIQEERSR